MAGAMPTMIAMTVALCLGALAGGAAASRATRPPTRVPVPTVPIGGGVEMPILGLGSCCGSYNVTSWLGMGLRHIDTSCDYGSEPAIGAAVRASGIPRGDIFITSKLNPEDYGPDMSAAMQSQVLAPLGMGYVDLLLLHHAGRVKGDPRPHPPCFEANNTANGTYYACRLQAWSALTKIKAAGQARAIGVSNWEIRDLEQLFNATGEYPAVNQIEDSPQWHTDELMAWCRSKGIRVEAYAPLANFPHRSALLKDPVFGPIAAAHGKSAAAVALRWELQAGADIVIPRSVDAAHQAQNLDAVVGGWRLSAAEVKALAALKQTKVYNTQCQPYC